MEYVLETEGLTKVYGDKEAASDVNLHIREGQIYGLIGRNGAGKTTIMRMISGLAIPTRGTYTLFGKSGKDAHQMLRQVGALIESPGIYPRLSAWENLKIKCLALGADPEKTVGPLLESVGLGDVDRKKPAGAFSMGMQQRLGIALALAGEPKLLILDEPINGLDPQGIAEVREILVKLRNEKGITMMISSHILDELAKLADAYGIINEGVLVDEFTAEELTRRSGRYVLLKTDNNEGTLKALEGIGIHDAAVDIEGCVRVNERLEDSPEMAKAVVGAGIALKEMFVQNVSLEDYFLNVTGGKKHA